MAERIRTEADRQARLEFLARARTANGELAATIPEKCSGCDEATVRALVLGDRVAKDKMTIDEARTNFSHDTGECEGTSYPEGVYDARPICGRVRKLGRIAGLQGYGAFPD